MCAAGRACGLAPLFSGGGQERGLRAGTLPAPLIIGLGEACRIALAEMQDDAARIAPLRDRLLTALQAGIPGLVVNGSRQARIPGNLNLTFPAATAAALDAGHARTMRLHRLGLLLGGDRALLRAAGDWA